jgi:hypothetical protein
MTTVGEHISNVDGVVCNNIEGQADNRALLAQNILSQLRNLVEGVAVLMQTLKMDSPFDWQAIQSGMAFVRSQGKLSFVSRFHGLLKQTASHFTLDGDSSERLMLKYYEYLFRIRALLRDSCGMAVLANLESFPVDLDPSLRDYHESIAAKVDAAHASALSDRRERYYIHKVRPFFVGGRVFYEVTFHRAADRVSKFDHVIAFTDIDMTDRYSAMLTLQADSIEVFGQTLRFSHQGGLVDV